MWATLDAKMQRCKATDDIVFEIIHVGRLTNGRIEFNAKLLNGSRTLSGYCSNNFVRGPCCAHFRVNMERGEPSASYRGASRVREIAGC